MMQFFASDIMLFVSKSLVLVGLFGLFQRLVAVRCAAMIHAWARQGGWQVVRTQRRFLKVGPFGFKPGLPVYHLVLHNSRGQERHAFVRCGHELISVLSDEMSVEWNAPAAGIAQD